MYTTRWFLDDGPLAMARRIGSLHNDFNRFFGTPFGGGSMVALNLWMKDDEALVEAEIPGVDMKDIEVSVIGDTLMIRGERKKDKGEGLKEECHRSERRFGAFSRTVEIPFKVDPEKVSARCRDGVLRVVLPRAEQDKAKKITVAAE